MDVRFGFGLVFSYGLSFEMVRLRLRVSNLGIVGESVGIAGTTGRLRASSSGSGLSCVNVDSRCEKSWSLRGACAAISMWQWWQPFSRRRGARASSLLGGGVVQSSRPYCGVDVLIVCRLFGEMSSERGFWIQRPVGVGLCQHRVR